MQIPVMLTTGTARHARETGPKGATIQFRGNRFADPAGLVGYLQSQDGRAKVRDNKLVIRRDWIGDDDRVRGAYAIVRDLARLVGKAAAA